MTRIATIALGLALTLGGSTVVVAQDPPADAGKDGKKGGKRGKKGKKKDGGGGSGDAPAPKSN